VTPGQVAAFRLARQHLDTRAPARALPSVVRDMAGAQAQVLSAAQISLWARVGGLLATDVDAALRGRTLVRAWCMRHTLHLVPADELAVFVRGSAGRAERDIRWLRGKGIADRVIDAVIDAALAAMDQPVTRREIAERVSRSLGVRQREYVGGGWGNRAKVPAVAVGGMTVPIVWLFNLIGARGVICSGPARGAEPTYVRADAWIHRWRDVTREVAEQRLLRRYLSAFGPATLSDFAYWVGLPLRDARAIWEREHSASAFVNVEGTTGAVLGDDLQNLAGAVPVRPPVRLLPYFDAYLLGHRERGHLVPRGKLKTIYRTQGWVTPVVLVDGRVAATWSLMREEGRLRIDVAPFAALPRSVRSAIRGEAHDLARFLAVAHVDLRGA
jgi:hypothetical protein